MSATPSIRRAFRAVAIAALLPLAAGGAAAQALTDPLRPPEHVPAAATAEATTASSGYVLQATQVSGSRRRAVINGRVVTEGDTLNGDARVVRIRHGSVQLARDQGPLVLYVSTPLRQPRAGATKTQKSHP